MALRPSKSLAGRFPVIISPKPDHQDLIIVAYSDGSVETHPFDEASVRCHILFRIAFVAPLA